MNLLIEQSSISSRSRRSHHHHHHHAMNSSSPALIFKFKRDPNISMANDDAPASRSNQSRPKRLTLPNSRRSSSPAFNGKQQTSKRSANIDNNNNDLTSQPDENAVTKRFKSDEFNVRVGSVIFFIIFFIFLVFQSSSHPTKKADASVETVSIGLATEPDQLGPCEPVREELFSFPCRSSTRVSLQGTSVVLEGIVWNETDSGESTRQ